MQPDLHVQTLTGAYLEGVGEAVALNERAIEHICVGLRAEEVGDVSASLRRGRAGSRCVLAVRGRVRAIAHHKGAACGFAAIAHKQHTSKSVSHVRYTAGDAHTTTKQRKAAEAQRHATSMRAQNGGYTQA